MFAGFHPFTIEPLQLGTFYFDPTWRRREGFKRFVLDQVAEALKGYCDRIEAGALAAGLKRARAPRRVRRLLRPPGAVSFVVPAPSSLPMRTRRRPSLALYTCAPIEMT